MTGPFVVEAMRRAHRLALIELFVLVHRDNAAASLYIAPLFE